MIEELEEEEKEGEEEEEEGEEEEEEEKDCYFQTMNMVVFEGRNSSNDIIIHDTMIDDGEVASDVLPRYNTCQHRTAFSVIWCSSQFFTCIISGMDSK